MSARAADAPREAEASEAEALRDLRTRHEEILRMARWYGVHDVRVFGSTATGDAREDSDVDLLVRLQPGRSPLELGGLQMDLADLLARPVDVVTEAGLRPRIRARVLAEAVPL